MALVPPLAYTHPVDELLQKTWNGERISLAEALQLYALPLETLGALAHRRRELAKAEAFELSSRLATVFQHRPAQTKAKAACAHFGVHGER